MLINLAKFDLDINGVIHVGAYIGEEILVYEYLDIKNVLFIEPREKHCQKLLERCGDVPLINCALGNYVGTAMLNVSKTNNDTRPWFNKGDGASSSILEPAMHLTQHPNISFEDQEEVMMTTLDTLVEQGLVDPTKYNMINIDIQGYELEAFMGAQTFLKNVDYVLTEVNNDEVYHGCALVGEIDVFLGRYGLKRIATNWAGGIWGDALYVKEGK